MLKVGIIGYGTVGRDVARSIAAGDAGDARLDAVLVRDLEKVRDVSIPGCVFTDNTDEFLGKALDVVVEAAGHNGVIAYAEPVLRSGSDFIVTSVGAFCDQELYDRVVAACRESGRQVVVPSAAVAGLDRVAAGAQGRLDNVTLVTRKPVKAWRGTFAEEVVDLDTVAEPVCIFEGSARDSARTFPESVNVSAAVSLAGIGFEKTAVNVYVDPTINSNTHVVIAKGEFGELKVEISNTPSATNPKTGYIVAMSIAKVIKGYTAPFVLGV